MLARYYLTVVLVLAASLATTAQARGRVNPTRFSGFNRWQCYVPGCNACEVFNPNRCTQCNIAEGYVMLPDGTCGCATGFGSYAVPSTGNFPMYAPSCPLTQTRNGLRSTSFRRFGRTVTPAAYYLGRPYYCRWGYYANGICQYPPMPGQGYCSCSRCPTGYTSAGGSIGSAVCVPTTGGGGGGNGGGNGGAVQRCRGRPPQAGNAQPWRKFCASIPVGNKCGAGADCVAPFIPDPTAGKPIPYCEANGVWVVRGACVAGAGAAACPGRPQTGENAQAWPATCVDGTVADTCETQCSAGFDGSAVATCTAGGWVVTSDCLAGTRCDGSPEAPENADPFPEDCVDGAPDDACESTCSTGFEGTVTAVCTADGWVVNADCTAIVQDAQCPDLPDDATDQNAVPWDDAALVFGVCQNAALGEICTGACAEGFTGTAEATCTEAGWELSVACDADAGGK